MSKQINPWIMALIRFQKRFAVKTIGVAICAFMLLATNFTTASAQQADGSNVDRAQILNRQRKLADQYQLLEQKLFTLYGYEKDKNPTRARLLEKAYQRSQSAATSTQLRDVVGMIENAKLRQAETEQAEVLEQLNELLALLQSEDRSKRLKDEIERYQEYLNEVEKLLRIQKGLRGQTEGGMDEQRIAKSESQAADRAGELSENIKANEEAPESEEDADENSAGDAEDANAKTPVGDAQENNGDDPGNADPAAPDKTNPVRKQIDIAEQRMRSAQQKLQEAQRGDAIEEMQAAEKEIAKAKKQLEEVLRQMREEEVERTLAKLEDRFRKMLERQIRVKQNTEKLAATEADGRGTDFDVQTGKLSTEQSTIAAQASQALLLLAEDGSSIAFLETVDEMHEDMLQISARLSSAKVGKFTIDLETEVIDTLNYLVTSLAETQRANEKDKEAAPQDGPSNPQPPGEEPLVGKIAELKMLRNLQDRIYRRHERYARQLESPDDPIGEADDPELIAALKRLTEKQKKLTTITRDIVESDGQ